MKNLGVIYAVFVLLISCTGGGPMKNNQYLGEVPSIAKNNIAKVADQEIALEKSKHEEGAMKKWEKLEAQKRKLEAEVKEYINKNPICGKSLPFEPLACDYFTINEVLLDSVFSYGKISVKFFSTANSDIRPARYNHFVYYKALDETGNEIENSRMVAAGSRTDVVPDQKLSAEGLLVGDRLEDFAKIVQITRDEYDARKKK